MSRNSRNIAQDGIGTVVRYASKAEHVEEMGGLRTLNETTVDDTAMHYTPTPVSSSQQQQQRYTPSYESGTSQYDRVPTPCYSGLDLLFDSSVTVGKNSALAHLMTILTSSTRGETPVITAAGTPSGRGNNNSRILESRGGNRSSGGVVFKGDDELRGLELLLQCMREGSSEGKNQNAVMELVRLQHVINGTAEVPPSFTESASTRKVGELTRPSGASSNKERSSVSAGSLGGDLFDGEDDDDEEETDTATQKDRARHALSDAATPVAGLEVLDSDLSYLDNASELPDEVGSRHIPGSTHSNAPPSRDQVRGSSADQRITRHAVQQGDTAMHRHLEDKSHQVQKNPPPVPSSSEILLVRPPSAYQYKPRNNGVALHAMSQFTMSYASSKRFAEQTPGTNVFQTFLGIKLLHETVLSVRRESPYLYSRYSCTPWVVSDRNMRVYGQQQSSASSAALLESNNNTVKSSNPSMVLPPIAPKGGSMMMKGRAAPPALLASNHDAAAVNNNLLAAANSDAHRMVVTPEMILAEQVDRSFLEPPSKRVSTAERIRRRTQKLQNDIVSLNRKQEERYIYNMTSHYQGATMSGSTGKRTTNRGTLQSRGGMTGTLAGQGTMTGTMKSAAIAARKVMMSGGGDPIGENTIGTSSGGTTVPKPPMMAASQTHNRTTGGGEAGFSKRKSAAATVVERIMPHHTPRTPVAPTSKLTGELPQAHRTM